VEAFDMARKLAFAGKHSPIPFMASPVYIGSQIAWPLLGSCRVFVPLEFWTDEGVMDVAREIASTLGPTEQFDVGIAPEMNDPNLPGGSISGEPARLTKIDPESDLLVLRLNDAAWKTHYPRLEFDPIGLDEWRRHVDRGIAANPVEEVAEVVENR
jgi:hypothetical protein